ncbi:hypothetical protein KC19_1G165800 [Ceratodon purpureus]|uniref:E3 ubiquitin-protein ligase RNF170 n=1 Tax=Ceratodon purpureus TaxID=3225 RepID=A0A8T0J8V2_CERPU|nr:hypothetical protein KC19_1G165800 [Ceratodon purpureus]
MPIAQTTRFTFRSFLTAIPDCPATLPALSGIVGLFATLVGLSGRRGSEGGRDSSSLPSASAGGRKEGGSWRKDQTMPIIDGVGDELLYTALLAAPLLFLCRHSLGQSLSFLKQGVYFVRVWVGSLWGSVAMREEDSGNVASPLERTTSSNSFAARMNSPPENDCCSVCHDSFSLPCQANCSHWFCGECILRVWQHSSVLQPCKCPICRRAITLLLSTEISEAQQQDSEVSRIIRDIEKYNRIFGGGPVSFMQRVRDMPLLLRRMVGELMDPQRAIPLVHRTRILFFLVLLAVYVFSPLDVIPEGVLGLVGLLDDLLVIIMVLFYLAMLYRSTLILHHGGQPQ